MEDKLGTIGPGDAADVMLLRLVEGGWPFVYAWSVVETGRQRLEPASVVRGGEVHPRTPSAYAPVPHVH